MLFHYRRKIQALRHELEAARMEAMTAKRDRDAALHRLDALEQEQSLARRVFENLAGFGESVVALRQSFAELSQLLASNQQSAGGGTHRH